jgi:VWFA-related protein
MLFAASAVAYAQEQAPARVEVTLTGGKGRAAPELKKEDVRVYVDGVERPVVSFEKQVQPVSYGLVVDNSGSLRSQANAVVAAAKYILEQNEPADEAFVLRFVSSDNIELLQRLTADRAALERAVYSMRIQGGQTALLDALYTAGDYLIKNSNRADTPGRRLALILVSDGEDRLSSHKVEEVLKLLKGGGVGLTGALEDYRGFISKGRREKAKDLLAKLASETGGRVYYVEKEGELEKAVGDVVGSMRTRYVVGYTPPEPNVKGKGKVEVRLVGAAGKEKLKAHLLAPAEKN